MQNKPQANWTYSKREWEAFVDIEKANKKEDSIYFGIGILILGIPGLMFLRDTSFLIALAFTVPFAFLIPYLRMRLSYQHLRKGIKNPEIKIYFDKLLINNHEIVLQSKKRRVKSMKIIETETDMKLLEFDVQWITNKGPTNDEFRIPIPSDKIEEAVHLIEKY